MACSPRECRAPQEQLKEKGSSKHRFTIGAIKEHCENETRVPLTPQGVGMLVEAGHDVYLERGLGLQSKFADIDYTERGGILVSRSEALKQDVILMITPPSVIDIQLMKKCAMLFSLMSFNKISSHQLGAMHQKSLTSVALDWIEGDMGECPVADSMSEVEGNAAIVLAAQMSAYGAGRGAMLGSVAGVSPSEVVILGAGVAGQTAARCAIGMGATVKFFDSSLHALQNVRTIFGSHISTSILHPTALGKAMQSAEVVIGALHVDDSAPHFLISDDLINKMKKGTILIDLNIDRGGSFETSKVSTLKNPTYELGGSHYCCLPSLSVMYPRTASIALSNVLSPMLLNINAYESRGQYICSELGFQCGIYMYNGVLANHELARRFNLSAKDLQLLLTVF